MKARVGAALLCAWALFVVWRILSVNPALLDLSFDRITEKRRAPMSPPSASHVVHPFHSSRAEIPGGAVSSMYRGSITRTGVAEDALAAELVETWNIPDINAGIHGANKGSPAVDESGVYVGSDTSWFYAFDLDGKLRWKFFVGNSSHGIHSTPALDSQRVYFGAYNGVMYALDKSDGAVVWATKLGDAIGSSAGIVGDAIYVSVETSRPANGFIAKLDRNSGAVTWLSGWLGEQAHSSPAVSTELGLAFAGANNQRFVGVSVDSGEIVWSFHADAPIKGTSMVTGGRVYFVTMVGTIYALDAKTGKELWNTPLAIKKHRVLTSVAWIPEPELIAVATGRVVTVLDATSGEVRWKYRNEAKSKMNLSPIAARSGEQGWTLWAGCSSKELCAFDPLSGEVRSRILLRARLTGAIVPYRGALYVAMNETGGLSRFDAVPVPVE
jgi:outer membrane protein assembly factor BamB